MRQIKLKTVAIVLLGILFVVTGRFFYRKSLSLSDAIYRGDVKLVREKLKAIDSLDEDKDGRTYIAQAFRLHYRGRRGHTKSESQIEHEKKVVYEMVELLIQKGADVNLPQTYYYKQTPLHLSIHFDSPKVMELLLDNGASYNVVMEDGDTPLIYAAGTGSIQCVELLLNYGARSTINVRNQDGNTALHEAVRCHGLPEIIEPLLNYGADPLIKNNKNETAIDLAKDLAKKYNRSYVLEIIQRHLKDKTQNKPPEKVPYPFNFPSYFYDYFG
ncbi:MAG: ankyrin repeat domain-containing protein [Planctomycetes bacterium]|nr:ankyrin repeat domain-containing protein [Planctomycetota bacterium]